MQAHNIWWGYSSCDERCDVHQKCWCMVPELACTMIESLHAQRMRHGLPAECETAMNAQLTTLMQSFAPLLNAALQMRTLTMAGLDETEAVAMMLLSLCTWWQHRLTVVANGEF